MPRFDRQTAGSAGARGVCRQVLIACAFPRRQHARPQRKQHTTLSAFGCPAHAEAIGQQCAGVHERKHAAIGLIGDPQRRTGRPVDAHRFLALAADPEGHRWRSHVGEQAEVRRKLLLVPHADGSAGNWNDRLAARHGATVGQRLAAWRRVVAVHAVLRLPPGPKRFNEHVQPGLLPGRHHGRRRTPLRVDRQLAAVHVTRRAGVRRVETHGHPPEIVEGVVEEPPHARGLGAAGDCLPEHGTKGARQIHAADDVISGPVEMPAVRQFEDFARVLPEIGGDHALVRADPTDHIHAVARGVARQSLVALRPPKQPRDFILVRAAHVALEPPGQLAFPRPGHVVFPQRIDEHLLEPKRGGRRQQVPAIGIRIEVVPVVLCKRGPARSAMHRELAQHIVHVRVIDPGPCIQVGGFVADVGAEPDEFADRLPAPRLVEDVFVKMPDGRFAGVARHDRANESAVIEHTNQCRTVPALVVEALLGGPPRHVVRHGGVQRVRDARRCVVVRPAAQRHTGFRAHLLAQQRDALRASVQFPRGAVEQVVHRAARRLEPELVAEARIGLVAKGALPGLQYPVHAILGHGPSVPGACAPERIERVIQGHLRGARHADGTGLDHRAARRGVDADDLVAVIVDAVQRLRKRSYWEFPSADEPSRDADTPQAQQSAGTGLQLDFGLPHSDPFVHACSHHGHRARTRKNMLGLTAGALVHARVPPKPGRSTPPMQFDHAAEVSVNVFCTV